MAFTLSIDICRLAALSSGDKVLGVALLFAGVVSIFRKEFSFITSLFMDSSSQSMLLSRVLGYGIAMKDGCILVG